MPIALLLELIESALTPFALDSAISRSLKSDIGLPVSHEKLERIRARLLIAVLACYAAHLLSRGLDVEHAQ